jgi:hypothetical protein
MEEKVASKAVIGLLFCVLFASKKDVYKELVEKNLESGSTLLSRF